MLTRLGYYADKALEAGWLAVAIFIPMFFNVYSSRVFEPDKISLMRSLALLMTIAWVVKLAEGGWRAIRESNATTPGGKVVAAAQGAAEGGLPSWLGFLRVPMVLPILVYALAYLISSVFTMTPDATWWGSYQRLQGTYTQYSYMVLGIIVLFNLRTRVQLERLITFMIMASLPVALYGLLQANRLDPLPWAGDTATRVASSMGNAIFVAAWLIIVVPFALYRFLNGVNLWLSGRGNRTEAEEDGDGRRGRPVRRTVAYEADDYGWALVGNVTGLILADLLIFGFVLKLIAGLPLPDAQLWPSLPIALILYYFSIWGIEWLNRRRHAASQAGLYLWIVGALLFVAALLAFVPSWSIGAQNTGIDFHVDGLGFLWAIFFMLLWGSITATAYALGANRTGVHPNHSIVRQALNVGYAVVLVLQIACIYLTQSRGPWLGLGVGLVAFAVGLWLVGRTRKVRWMDRIGGTASAIVLVGAIFIGLLNIPSSPLQALGGLPGIGRGIERLSTLTRTEDGTGKVRTLIWQGATQLIASDPLRTLIGYGPESMYVVYNKFYPPELAHWELRNATPDRSHNVEFDHMVTMGVMGLLTYYFLVGSFLFYAIRIIKRARSTQDQLLAITLAAAISAHFVEIQTGIQIVATWSYFYMIIGATAAFGYFITNYLRTPEAPAAEQTKAARVEASEEALAAQTVAVASSARQTVGTASTQKTVAASVGGNGRPPVTTSAGGANGARAKARSAGGRDGAGSSSTASRAGANTPAARRQQTSQVRIQTTSSQSVWLSNPIFGVVYALLLIMALVLIFKVNVATVQADTLYKQGQAYDNAQQWSSSVQRYQAAIDLQPNQDYYYLFLGRSYLEWAKVTDQELAGNNPRTNKPYTQQEKDTERLGRLKSAEAALMTARALNPLNTDHYANLGRLYLYWADPTGGKDDSKKTLAAQYMQEAVDNSPGNAQLWDELAVADARNGNFQKAMDDLEHSQTAVDSTYQRTPFIRGQLLQERADAVKQALINKQPLPTGGETDYGKLVIQAGKAFSDSIALDPSYFVDNGMGDTDTSSGTQPGRVTWFLGAGQPFTNTNSTVDPVQLKNVLTDTIVAAFKIQEPLGEKALADLLRSRGVYTGADNKVPASVLNQLSNNPDWAQAITQNTRQWTDADMKTVTQRAVVPYAALAYIVYKLGDTQGAIADYQRAIEIDPANYFNQFNLGRLLSSQQDCAGAIQHLQAAFDVVSNAGDLNSDAERQSNYQAIQQALSDAQNQKECK